MADKKGERMYDPNSYRYTEAGAHNFLINWLKQKEQEVSSNTTSVASATHKVGNIYQMTCCGDVSHAILAQTDENKVNLINLGRNANRWTAPIKVARISRITEEEWKLICRPEWKCELLEGAYLKLVVDEVMVRQPGFEVDLS